MEFLRGQGVARLAHQAASGLMVVVHQSGCRFSGSSRSTSSDIDEVEPKPATSVEKILHQFDPAVGRCESARH
jgi:hypothetical protein